eukprot:TRINITY_DN17_c0_g3_i2.p1 TRINITY_DN17_c0_g3~~TRINITY_DN17_c0_g3_i2.p1  ORF type:complete len:396 (+),score=115.59 TRINITY_DN17_c0_g3_i2:84-1271(+)
MKRAADDDAPFAKQRRVDDDKRNLIVNYLPMTVDDDGLLQMFEHLGEVERAKVMMDEKTRGSRCFGFVKYRDAEAAAEAIETMNGKQYGAKQIRVAYARERGQANAKVYISGFGPMFQEEHLRSLCSDYGDVVHAKVLDSKHPSYAKGVGFCTFRESQEAQKCLSHLDGLDFSVAGQPCRLTVGMAHGRGRDDQITQPRIPRTPLGDVPMGSMMQPAVSPLMNVPQIPMAGGVPQAAIPGLAGLQGIQQQMHGLGGGLHVPSATIPQQMPQLPQQLPQPTQPQVQGNVLQSLLLLIEQQQQQQQQQQSLATPRANICRHWIVNRCTYGSECRFLHPPQETPYMVRLRMQTERTKGRIGSPDTYQSLIGISDSQGDALPAAMPVMVSGRDETCFFR